MMTRGWSTVWIAGLAMGLGLACAKKKQQAPPQPPGPPPSALVRGDEDSRSNEKAKPTVAPTEERRRGHVQQELARYNAHLLTFDGSQLSAAEKRMLKALLKAARLTEALNMLQIHPQNLKYGEEIAKTGTRDDKRLFRRYQQPWCLDGDSPLCNAHPRRVPKQIGHYHWPPKMTDAEYEQIRQAPNAKALLSPFTVVRRGAKPGTFKAVPYAAAPLFARRLEELAAALKEAAEHATEPSLKKFLQSRAKALVTPQPFPYDASDYDWIALTGKWEVTVGPYEVYLNPRRVKARFEMYIGVEDKTVTERARRFKTNLQDMENALAQLVGPQTYRPRKLDPRISIRAIRVVMAAGDGRKAKGATVAYHLPNRGKSVDEGLYKKVMLVNHSEAFDTIVRRRAQLILEAAQQPLVSSVAGMTNVTFHEFAHGFGSHSELKIKTKDGKPTTVKVALGPHTSLMEELKADITALWLVDQSVKRKWITPAQAKKRYVSGLMHTLGLASYPLKGTYPRMASVQLGWLMDKGGVVWSQRTGRFQIDFTRIGAAVESLTKHVATLQLTGDRAGATQLIERYVKPVDGGKGYEHVGAVKIPIARMKNTFKKARIKSIALSYQVTGL